MRVQIIRPMVSQPLNIALMKESTIKLRVGICLFWRSIISGCDLSADYALANELCQAFR